MKILVSVPYSINTPHFETALEICQVHIDQGDDVSIVACNIDLLTCDTNVKHNISRCLNCVGRLKTGLALLSQRIKLLPMWKLTQKNKQDLQTIQLDFENISELKRYRIDNFDIGYAVASSLISWLRDPEPDLSTKINREVLKRFLLSSYAVYCSFRNHLNFGNYEKVYLYNGRFGPLRAILRACEAESVAYFSHEVGSDISRYMIYENALPHDTHHIDKLIRESWEDAPDPILRNEIAEEFFKERSQGIPQIGPVFTEQQKVGLLSRIWNESKKNIAIFVSSEDEFAAIGDIWRNSIYLDQLDAIHRILDSSREDDRLHFYLRIHPNLIGVRNKQTESLTELQASNLRVISADSPVSTYELLLNADSVITFGSTVGIEAAYWGKPSILAGQSLYRNLGSTYNVNNHEELMSLLNNDLEAKSKEGALMYGYFQKTFGIPFQYYLAEELYRGTFKGTEIQPKFGLRLFAKGIHLTGKIRPFARINSSIADGRTWAKWRI